MMPLAMGADARINIISQTLSLSNLLLPDKRPWQPISPPLQCWSLMLARGRESAQENDLLITTSTYRISAHTCRKGIIGSRVKPVSIYMARLTGGLTSCRSPQRTHDRGNKSIDLPATANSSHCWCLPLQHDMLISAVDKL